MEIPYGAMYFVILAGGHEPAGGGSRRIVTRGLNVYINVVMRGGDAGLREACIQLLIQIAIVASGNGLRFLLDGLGHHCSSGEYFISTRRATAITFRDRRAVVRTP